MQHDRLIPAIDCLLFVASSICVETERRETRWFDFHNQLMCRGLAMSGCGFWVVSLSGLV
ncbi:hypothetical protein [Solemya elarraichensis gill symbiont]|uniref:Uncharacterized protein n=1 Tax=Solemya elarraichensis gill symbiont TaxID=1918949 RepID=A0A1T2KZP2_9GAMM|nr:hypothetical protein [Solemya elarraichensis gill symbiont]OOZ38186.1 hypothetical protein BOW52_09085 [Solemya elarraichensis gill symbiont]